MSATTFRALVPERPSSRVTAYAQRGETGATMSAQRDATPPAERLTLGVAARLSRYLQVLTEAKKMGKETISSQELSDYTHVNPTQIRRDLSGFGKFGKRGVGYNIDSLVTQIRKILRTSGQHNIALFGAGHLGDGDRLVGHLRRPRLPRRRDLRRGSKKVGRRGGEPRGAAHHGAPPVVEEQDIVVGVLAVPPTASQELADQLVEAGVRIIFNYSDLCSTFRRM